MQSVCGDGAKANAPPTMAVACPPPLPAQKSKCTHLDPQRAGPYRAIAVAGCGQGAVADAAHDHIVCSGRGGGAQAARR